MASRIEHRADLAAPASRVRAALVSTEYLRDRLAEIGGPGAELVDHGVRGGTVTYRLRQTVPADRLPSFTKSVFRGDLVVERTETWDDAAGTTTARVTGVPGEITAAYTLTDTASGCTWRTDGRVQVKIPLVGGKIEKVIAEQVGRLLAAETAFTADWLATR
ncbi:MULTISPECIES: DUF2505 domain-containing protein [Actinokineospora]|nr:MULTISPECIES: DUF2505 domain-containing protein [Actinokineospora]UVS82332.1 hypothetical protein Actkin_06101 [Actinokineospora sp. UTMC 2448]